MLDKSRAAVTYRKKIYSNFLLPFLIITTFVLVLFNKTDYFFVNKIKEISINYVNPLSKIINLPINILNNTAVRISNIQVLESQNIKLKEEIIRLKKWQTLAIKNSRENRVFKSLLNSTSHEVDIIKTAAVINQSPGIYNKLVTINAGRNFNIIKDLAAINEKGLVGKIVATTNKNSRILLINDSTSSIPVKTLSDGVYSILSGVNNGKYLKSTFIKGNDFPKIGDLLVTSGNAKIFPRDILVARVVKVNDDHYIALPYVDFDNLNYIQVVKSK